ncbi:hypothetical protein ES703_121918 [subsurface metagenome]
MTRPVPTRADMATRLFYTSTKEDICQAFGRWIDGMAPWEWYATLTFRDPKDPRFPTWTKVGWKSAHNALNSFNNALVQDLDYVNPLWVSVMELQDRGVPHWHALVANVADQRRMKWVDWWFEHYGIARILPYQAERGARYYLGKYLSKEQADIRFSPALDAQLRRKS